MNLLTGKPVINKVLDSKGNLLPQYCNIRSVRNGVMSYGLEIELIHAVENDIADNLGLVGLEKVEWRGAHIGPKWMDVTEFYRNAYNERETDYAS